MPIGKNKKVIGLMKDELGGKVMTELVALRPKSYSYSMDDDSEAKKAKETKTCVMKRMFKFNYYKDCLLNNGIIFKSQQRFKNEAHNVYTEEVNKIALSSNVIKDYRLLIELHHILMEQVQEKSAKQSC